MATGGVTGGRDRASDPKGWAVTTRPTKKQRKAAGPGAPPVDRSRSWRVMRRRRRRGADPATTVGAARPAEAARRREAPSPRRVPSFAGPGGRESFVLGAQWMDSDRRRGDAATPGGRGMGRMGLWRRKAEEVTVGEGEGGKVPDLLRGARAGHELVSLC